MYLKLESDNLSDYLKHTDVIDYRNDDIAALAEELRNNAASKLELTKNTYEYVRDKIHHSADIEAKVVTCKSSKVLRFKEGLCYAKAHLLAALLRCNGIPCGFCYQFLNLNLTNSLVLHGLNGVYIEELQKWIRLDARGNKEGINAQFSIGAEQLAYPIQAEQGEKDILFVFVEPDLNIIQTLTKIKGFAELWLNLPYSLNAKY